MGPYHRRLVLGPKQRCVSAYWRRIVCCLVLAFGLSLGAAAASAVEVQGHRGARGLWPENSLRAFAAALSIGVDVLELDVVLSKDGQLVVSHNPAPNPEITRDETGAWIATDGPAFKELTYEEIARLDVGEIKPGSRYGRRLNEQMSVKGTRIPLLKDVFELAKRAGNETVRFNIETKISPNPKHRSADPDAIVDALLAEISAAGLTERVIIQSFDWRSLQIVQRLAPTIPTAYLTAERSWFNNLQIGQEGGSLWTADYDIDDHGGSPGKLIKAAGGSIWSPYYMDLTPARLAEAQKLGLKVIVWTVNNRSTMSEMIKLGVDGIITDYPNRIRQVLLMLHMPPPKPTPIRP